METGEGRQARPLLNDLGHPSRADHARWEACWVDYLAAREAEGKRIACAAVDRLYARYGDQLQAMAS